jgi:hypothetical protein
MIGKRFTGLAVVLGLGLICLLVLWVVRPAPQAPIPASREHDWCSILKRSVVYSLTAAHPHTV